VMSRKGIDRLFNNFSLVIALVKFYQKTCVETANWFE